MKSRILLNTIRDFEKFAGGASTGIVYKHELGRVRLELLLKNEVIEGTDPLASGFWIVPLKCVVEFVEVAK